MSTMIRWVTQRAEREDEQDNEQDNEQDDEQDDEQNDEMSRTGWCAERVDPETALPHIRKT